MLELLQLDTKTLMMILFWYNISTLAVNFLYFSVRMEESKNHLLKLIMFAKICESFAFILLRFRDEYPTIVTIGFGYTLLIIGFYIESLCIYEILEVKVKIKRFLIFLITFLITFNLLEFVYANPKYRTITVSCAILILLFKPSYYLMFNQKSSYLKKVMGAFYMLFSLIQIPRMFFAMIDENIDLYSNNILQSMVFLSLLFLNILGNSMFLLNLKDSLDQTKIMLANKDYLTKLSNRYHFLSNVENIFINHRRENLSLVVLFFDLDNFKSVNDNYGHLFGDKVIIEFSKILATSLLESDLTCRYGGEEFVAFLPDSDCEKGRIVAERIGESVRKTVFEEVKDFRFTVSIGVVSGVPKECDSFENFLDVADKIMYKAKQNGRNRVEFCSYDSSVVI